MTRRGAGPGVGNPAAPGRDQPSAGDSNAAQPGTSGAGLGGAGLGGTGPSGAGLGGAGLGGAGPSGAGPPGPGVRRSRRLARRAGDPWRAAFLVILAVAIVLGAGWALLGSSLLVVRHVQVTGQHQVSAAEVRAAAGIRPGTPLARLNAAAATRRIERLTWVLSARVSRSWPDTVVISVRERTPALAVASAGEFEVVDIWGVVVGTSARRPAGLPLLESAPARLRGNPIIRAAVLVMGDLPTSVRRRVRSVTAVAADAVTLHLRDGILVRWGGTGESAAKARELRALMRTHARYYDVSSPATAVTAG